MNAGLRLAPDQDRVRVTVDAYCRTCKRRHQEVVTPNALAALPWTWHDKHFGHDVTLVTTRRQIPPRFRDKLLSKLGCWPWYLGFRENANLKTAYASSAALTVTLASLGSSTPFTQGRETTLVTNSTPS